MRSEWVWGTLSGLVLALAPGQGLADEDTEGTGKVRFRVTFSSCPSIKEGVEHPAVWTYRLKGERMRIETTGPGGPHKFRGRIQGPEVRLEARRRRGRSAIVGRRVEGFIDGQLIVSRMERGRACTAIAEINREVDMSLPHLGVPECDDYIAKYTACISDKMPEAAREAMMETLHMAAEGWRKTAKTEEGREALAQGCLMAAEAAKKAMASYNCEW